LIVDLSKHFREIMEVGADTVRVQPGVVHRHLNEILSKTGRRFAPDPASGGHCTIGRMVATNASGARALRHGYTRDHVAGLRIILDNGDAATVGLESRWPPAEASSSRLSDIILALGP